MRWLARVFASAIARRVAYVLVAALIAWLGMGKAHAQDYSHCGDAAYARSGNTPYCTDQATAVTTAATAGVAYCQLVWPGRTCSVVNITEGNRLSVAGYGWTILVSTTYKACGATTCSTSNGFAQRYPEGNSCKSKSPYTGVFPGAHGGPRSGSVQCFSSCMVSWFDNGDDTYTGKYDTFPGVCGNELLTNEGCQAALGPNYYFNPVIGVCEPKPPESCPAGQTKTAKGDCVDSTCPAGMVMQQDGTCDNEKNECPAGQVKSPAGNCLPGDGQCAAGEAMGKDGTCKRDSDGDGEPDEGEDDGTTDPTFGGGDSCNSPPSCSGDVILCGQARIQWRIDCNTRKNRNVSGGTCSTPPVCTGEKCDAVEYSSLLMQWRTACATEKLAGTGPGNQADPNVAAIKDALTGNAGTPDIGAEGDPAGAFSDESGYGEGGAPGNAELDDSGMGFARTCPTIPDVVVFGQSLHFDTSAFCQWVVLGGQIMLALAALLSLRIISSSGGDA